MQIFKKKEKFIYKDQYHYPIHNMLNVTDACNLACRYCFVEQHPHYMTLDIAKQAIDWTYQNYLIQKEKGNLADNDKPNITFFGGEPMLMFDTIIKPVVLYAEEKYNNFIDFGMTTNCTLLSKERIDFLAEHHIAILCSIDGAEITQCYNRPCRNGDNSSKLIEKNIPYLLEKIPEACFRSTGYAPTIQYLYENYKYAQSLGFKQYRMCVDERHKWSKIQVKILEEQISKIMFDQLKQQIENNGQFIMEARMYSSIFEFILDKLQDKKILKDGVMRCGLGTNSVAIGWNGKLYGCQQDVTIQEKTIMQIGDLTNGINIKSHTKLLKSYIKSLKTVKYPQSFKKCHNCFMLEYCKNGALSGCLSTNYELFKNMHKIAKIQCNTTQIFYKQYLLYHNILYLFFNENENEK